MTLRECSREITRNGTSVSIINARESATEGTVVYPWWQGGLRLPLKGDAETEANQTEPTRRRAAPSCAPGRCGRQAWARTLLPLRGPLAISGPAASHPTIRRAFLPPPLVLGAGKAPARGKGAVCRGGGAGMAHSWVTSGRSAEEPNGTEGSLSSREGRGCPSVSSLRGA